MSEVFPELPCGDAGPIARAATTSEPAWKRINALFSKYGLPPPPTPLRDELVCHLVMHDRAGGYRP